MAATPEKVTDEQASAAIQQLTGIDITGKSEVAEPDPAEPEQAEPAAEPDAPAAEPETEEAPVAAAESDDVQSLKKRLDTIEAERKRDKEESEERLRAIQERHAANERILRDRFLRKSTHADKALRTLKAVRTEAGVPEAEVDRIIAELQGTMNPESASYAPPPPESYAQASEDQIVTLNSFLNEKGMTMKEAEEFGKWLRGDANTALTPQEQAVATQSLDGFLRLAHTRFTTVLRETETLNQKRQADAAAAVKAAQRTQRAAAQAATAAPSASRKPTVAKPADPKKLTKNQISELMQRAVEEATSGSY